jgi:hypothetical protein
MALLLSAGAASAQGMSKDTPERAPAAQQSAPAEKVAPSIKSQQKPSTTGQATSDKADKALNDKAGKAKETTGQSPKSESGEKTQNRSMEKSTDTEKSGASTNTKTEKSGESTNSKTDMRSKSETSPTTSKSTQSTTEQNRTTTGQGAAAGSAKLTTEQRTKISSVIKQQKVERVNLNVSVSVGTRIPASVHVHPLPREVIVIYPEWRGFDYILVGDEIVIISPRTHEIVAVIPA